MSRVCYPPLNQERQKDTIYVLDESLWRIVIAVHKGA